MDPHANELVRLTILGNVLRGPVGLGALVAQIEDLVLGRLNGSPRHIARTLHEMQRGENIVLANDGQRWRVSLGPRGRESYSRLLEAHPGALA